MPISLNNVFGAHEAALRLRAQRTELLGSNLANADTPNYKARDIDFQAAMREAMAGQGAATLKTTQPGHISGSTDPAAMDYVKFRVPTQPSLDGNTVETEVEQAAFARNAIEYQATLTFQEGQGKSIINALKGES